jgi:uncharacterized membrane protein YccC
MIGGTTSHGATLRKVTVRILGAVLGGALTAAAIIILSPNFGSLPSYTLAIFGGAAVMAYIGQGGGILAFMAIGATVFLIALSGVNPRDNVFASLWTVWGIIIGMVIRAIVSMVWIEHAPRTLAEEFRPVIAGLAGMITRSADSPLPRDVSADAAAVIDGLGELLAVANDARLEGRSAGIDPAALLEVLENLIELACLAAAFSPAGSAGVQTAGRIRARLLAWHDYLERQAASRRIDRAPLREMVMHADHLPQPLLAGATPGTAQPRLAAAFDELERSFGQVSLYRL